MPPGSLEHLNREIGYVHCISCTVLYCTVLYCIILYCDGMQIQDTSVVGRKISSSDGVEDSGLLEALNGCSSNDIVD